MLKVDSLFKTYKNAQNPAIHDVSFTVNNGEVFGLVGKNGAGKSTTIKCITGIHSFESGSITINTFDIKKHENKAKSLIGYVPDNHSVYECLTGLEYVNFMADIYNVSQQNREKRIRKYAKLFNLENALHKQISGYSHGMKQKICIIGALVHEPKLWILDEPFLGLDMQGMEVVKKSIIKYSRNKKHMVIFSSHNYESVCELCDKVCVIDQGTVKAVLDMKIEGSKEKLKKLMLWK